MSYQNWSQPAGLSIPTGKPRGCVDSHSADLIPGVQQPQAAIHGGPSDQDMVGTCAQWGPSLASKGQRLGRTQPGNTDLFSGARYLVPQYLYKCADLVLDAPELKL